MSALARDRLFISLLGILFFSIPLVIKNPYYLNVLNIVGLNVLVVAGLTLLIGYAGQISLGHGGFYAMGAYISALLAINLGWSPWVTTLVAMAATGVTALLIGVPTLRLKGHYLVMATLGFNLIVYILLVQLDDLTGGPSGLPGIPSYTIGSWSFNTDLRSYWLIWALTLGGLFLSFNLVHSRMGRALVAIRESEVAASCLGIETWKQKTQVFVLSAVMASLAGSLYAHYMTFISPKTFDIFYSIEVVAMVIIGGIGSLWGALLGSAFLTPLPHLLHFFDEYKDIIYGTIFMGVLIFSPQGLVGGLVRLYQKRKIMSQFKKVKEMKWNS
jgi:branched-chain amino acid transport system permease protein